MALGFEFLRSPGPVAQFIAVLYLGLLAGGVYYTIQIFKREGILFGHFTSVFRLLTRLRIWSIRHRSVYTVLVSAILVSVFLLATYWAERAHAMIYDVEPLFSSVTGFIQWTVVLAVSALEKGTAPRSFFGFVMVAVFPVVLIGSILTIVRFTSQRAHQRLVNQMATGNTPSYRVAVFNYQEKYDEFIESILTDSNAFIVLFAKPERLSDARSFKQSFERTSSDEYRFKIEELSYSEDLLFGRYDLLGCDELYLLSDRELETDYRNLQFVTEINSHVRKKVEASEGDSVHVPETVWLANDATISAVSSRLDGSVLQTHLYTLNFQDDIDKLININTGDPIAGLNEYFNLSTTEPTPEWIQGDALDRYSFYTTPLTDEELHALTELHRTRTEQEPEERLQARNRHIIEDIESRLAAESPDPFYGVLTDVAGTAVPIDPATANRSYQFETARQSIQISSGSDPSTGDLSEAGDLFLVNYNTSVQRFLTNQNAVISDDGTDRDIVVFYADEQITPEETENVQYITFDVIPDLLNMLFTPDGPCPQLSPGDTLLILLDNTVEEPQINSLKIINAINERLAGSAVELTHNDILLAVESMTNAGSEEFRHLSVDKVLQTGQTEIQFLQNLATFRTAAPLQALQNEGKLTSQEAFEWALETAYYFREFEIQPAREVYIGDRRSESAVGHDHGELVSELRTLDGDPRQLFVSFELQREGDQLTVRLHELVDDHTVTADEYLTFIPYL